LAILRAENGFHGVDLLSDGHRRLNNPCRI
jgi:hypothetical protein